MTQVCSADVVVTRPRHHALATQHWPIIGICVAGLLASWVSSPWSHWQFVDFGAVLAQGVISVVLWPLVAILAASRCRRRARPVPVTARAWWRRRNGRARLSDVGIALLTLSATVAVCSGWKRRLGHQTEFVSDPLWHRIDVLLHGGRSPVSLLAPVLEFPDLVAAIELWYYPGTFVLSLIAFGAMLWAPAGAARTRLLTTTALTVLVLGAAAATLAASAGPLFYGLVVEGPDPYAWLVDRLSRAPTGLAMSARQFLWAHQPPSAPPESGAAGISAMPSMHVALMATYLLTARTYGRRQWVRLAWVALAATLLGSVLLGLHYAVDGYASLLGVAIIWAGVGRAQRWHARRGWAAWRTAPRGAMGTTPAPSHGS